VAKIDSDQSYDVDSGTSFAAPHVAAIFAHFISYENLQTDSVTIQKRFKDNQQFNEIGGLPSDSVTFNRLANTGIHNPLNLPGKPYLTE
jgi:subtilisin family serine protease